MGFAGKLAYGVLSGLAGYHGEKAKQEAEARRDEILFKRQQAHAEFQHSLRRDEIKLGAEETRKTNTSAAADKVAGEVALQPYRVAAEKDVATHKSKISAAEAERDYLYDIRKLEAQHGYKIAEEEYQQGLQAAREAADRGERVVATGVDAQGNIVVVKGNDSKVTVHGVAPTKTVASGGKGEGGTDRVPRDRGAPAKSAPPAKEPADAASLTADINRLTREYDKATPETHPSLFRNGKKISVQEAMQAIRQFHGA